MFRISGQSLVINFKNKIDSSTNFLLAEILKYIPYDINLIILNLENTKTINLPGAMYLICFCHYIKEKYNLYMDTKVIIKDDNLLLFMMQIGFFKWFSIYGNLRIDDKILSEEERIQNNLKYTSSGNKLIFPIEIIPQNPNNLHFDTYIEGFVNKFNNFYKKLSSVYEYLNDPNHYQEIWETNYEIIKNIHHHSESLGFGAVYTDLSNRKNIITYFDTGIGIINSVINSTSYQQFPKDITTIYWALKPGNSSKGMNIDNQGIGFTILEENETKKNGIIALRTDKYNLIFKNSRWTDSQSEWFPGTQIIIYTRL